MNLARGLLILFIFSSNQLIDSVIFYCTFYLYAFMFSLVFIISLLLLTLNFECSSFLIILDGKLDFLFEIFLIS